MTLHPLFFLSLFVLFYFTLSLILLLKATIHTLCTPAVPLCPSMLLLLLLSLLISFHICVACCQKQLSSHKIIDLLLRPYGHRPIRARGDYLSFLWWLSPLSLGFVCPNNGALRGWNRNKLNKTCCQQNSKQLLQPDFEVRWFESSDCSIVLLFAMMVVGESLLLLWSVNTEQTSAVMASKWMKSLFYFNWLVCELLVDFQFTFWQAHWLILWVCGEFKFKLRVEIANRHTLFVLDIIVVRPKHSKISSFCINGMEPNDGDFKEV